MNSLEITIVLRLIMSEILTAEICNAVGSHCNDDDMFFVYAVRGRRILLHHCEETPESMVEAAIVLRNVLTEEI